MGNKWAFVVGIIILASSQARAASSFTSLTPVTINHQQLSIVVGVTQTGGGERFRVAVTHKPGVAYHSVNPRGWLEDGRSAGQGKPFPCSVAATDLGGGATIYRFTLPSRYLGHARFYFGYAGYDTGRMVMPSGDFYWFMPLAFTPSKVSTAKGRRYAGHMFSYGSPGADVLGAGPGPSSHRY